MRQFLNTSVNEFMIKSLIDNFKNSGFDVKFAKYSGYASPQKIQNHTPDVIAFDPKNSLVHIGLAKSKQQLDDTETAEQFKEFSKRLMKSGTSEKMRVPLHIAVPKDCESYVKRIFEKNSIPWKDSIQVVVSQ